MAKRKPNGEYSGLTGGLVIYESNGVGIMRGRPKKRKDKSALLKTVRSDFGYVVDRVKDLKTVIDIGFKDYKINLAAYHSAISVNMNNYKEALRLNKTDNIEWLQVSAGKLSGAETAASSRMGNGMIEITWQGTEPGRRNFDSDKVITGIYQKAKGQFLPGPEGVTRKDGKIILDPHKLTNGELMDVFMFFKAEGKNYKKKSESNVSASQWVGQFIL
jgi:hypothetical protein